MSLIGSILKLMLSLGALCFAIYMGLKLEPEKEMSDRAPLLLGVALSTFSPIGLILYIKYQDAKPEFASACIKQAMIGLFCFGFRALLTHLFPPVFEPWAR